MENVEIQTPQPNILVTQMPEPVSMNHTATIERNQRDTCGDWPLIYWKTPAMSDTPFTPCS